VVVSQLPYQASPSWPHAVLIAVQLFVVPLKPCDRREYSFMSLENSELSFSSNFDGVSYSTILPAHHDNSLESIYVSNPAATSDTM
jgi:hypothetical protein